MGAVSRRKLPNAAVGEVAMRRLRDFVLPPMPTNDRQLAVQLLWQFVTGLCAGALLMWMTGKVWP